MAYKRISPDEAVPDADSARVLASTPPRKIDSVRTFLISSSSDIAAVFREGASAAEDSRAAARRLTRKLG